MRTAELLELEGVLYDLETHRTAYTAREVATAENAPPHQVVKPVLVVADGEPVICAMPADRRLDLDALRSALGCATVRLAHEEELAYTCRECEVGAEPPIGRLFDVATVMDESIRDEEWVFFQAGTHTTSVLMSEADWERVARPRAVARFTTPA